MKVFIIASLARQVDGEMVFLRIDNGYTSASQAEAAFALLAKNSTELLPTPTGNVECHMERGIFDVDVQE